MRAGRIAIERLSSHRIERVYGTFTRSFALPNDVAADQVEAEMTEGVLNVKVPKRAEAQPKKIAVRTGGGTTVKPGQASRANLPNRISKSAF